MRSTLLGGSLLLAGGLVAAGLVVHAQLPAQPLTVEVAVVDRDGEPVAGLTADKFDVEVAGRRRKVIGVTPVPAAGGEKGPAYVIAVDALTFGQGSAKNVATVIRSVVSALPAGSLVGFATLPQGASVEISADRKALDSVLDGLGGLRQVSAQSGSFGLRAPDVIEYLGASDRTAIIQNFCGTAGEEDGCPSLLDQEVNVLINSLETQARASLGMLSSLTTRLGQVAGRKVLVLVSGGLPASERPGSRPDVGNLPAAIADAAARGNIAVYSVLLDRRLLDLEPVSGRGRQVSSPARDAEVMGRWLDQFSTSTGGALLRVQALTGDAAPARLARETSAHYVVAVEAAASDRAGSVQRLRVRVDQRGAIVRARQAVAVR